MAQQRSSDDSNRTRVPGDPGLRLGELLLRLGWLGGGDLALGLERQARRGGRLGRSLVLLGLLTTDQLARALGLQHDVPPAEDSLLDSASSAALGALPGEICEARRVIPFRLERGLLHLAMVDPHRLDLVQELSYRAGLDAVKPYALPELSFDRYLARYYRLVARSARLALGVPVGAAAEGGAPGSMKDLDPDPGHMKGLLAGAVTPKPTFASESRPARGGAGESDFEIVVAVDEVLPVLASGSSTEKPSPAKPPAGEGLESGRGVAARRRSRFAAKSITLLPADERRFGRYQMICRLASGGMADLFLAALPGPEGFQKIVVIKQVHEHLTRQQEFIQMFVDEARLVASISHPNVVQVMELGRVGDSYFMVMEYVAGENLTALLRRTRVPFEVGARIASSAAAGLHAAHELRDSAGELLQVVHRDISPENILLSYEGVVKILDFGVARARSNLRTTEGRVLKGKCGYVSPEQIAGEPVDRRVDVFSLGVVLWELTTRHRLFRGATEAESLARILQGLVRRPSDVVLGYPHDLEAIVMKALARDPSQRFQTADELQLALEGFLMRSGSPVVASSLASLMRETFADRIAAKRAVLREFEEVF